MRLSFHRLLFFCALVSSAFSQSQNTSCKVIPGDSGWPSQNKWALFNETLSGRLIATIPQALVCHTEPFHQYNESVCQVLQDNWNFAQTFEPLPAEFMNAYFQNQSCDPFTPVDRPCEIGNYAAYSVLITEAQDAVDGIQFAKKNNIRVTIKNTGHDYLGKSTGKGALSLWTNNLKSTEIIKDYTSFTYNGTAIKIGAGVTGGDLLELLRGKGYRTISGTCASVGVAGGYAAGGGHSILNGLYGMAADNVLEWELVTVDGRHIFASPTNEYADLYWAMTGGGAGVWGVVLSMVYKIHPDGIIGGGRLSFDDSAVNQDTYWKAVEAWHSWLPTYVDGLDGGNTAEYTINATAFEAISLTLPGQDAKSVDALMSEFLHQLENLGVPYAYSSKSEANFYDHFDADLGPLPFGPWPTNTLASGRIFPRSVMENDTSNSDLTQAIRNFTAYQDGIFFLGCEAMHVKETDHPPNAVLPAWRDNLAFCITHSYWDWQIPREKMLERKKHLVTDIVPSLEAVTPGSGSYLNELDAWYQGDWKQELYGINYDRLLQIKNTYDPEHLLFAHLGVGSEYWASDNDGRLCKA
ncbi:hypothetical protein F4808DRAFT_466253 [Astrocystis sublimbata]|nr:hypothetical protein F4808DRAFT_466250 [Astrocystis sublimbata]KAI0188078.1 hypothetical protein F4808DRAFT_466253 [Astrocystis sublimbata]